MAAGRIFISPELLDIVEVIPAISSLAAGTAVPIPTELPNEYIPPPVLLPKAPDETLAAVRGVLTRCSETLALSKYLTVEDVPGL